MKKLILFLISFLVATAVFAEVDPIATKMIKDLMKGRNNANAPTKLNVLGDVDVGDDLTVTDDSSLGGDVSVGGDLTVDDDATITDDLSVGGLFTIGRTSTSVTNGQVLTVVATMNLITPTGSANGGTNTITLANPLVIGKMAYFAVETGSTNVLAFGDSGNLALSGATVLGVRDTLGLVATATNEWTELFQTDN